MQKFNECLSLTKIYIFISLHTYLFIKHNFDNCLKKEMSVKNVTKLFFGAKFPYAVLI